MTTGPSRARGEIELLARQVEFHERVAKEKELEAQFVLEVAIDNQKRAERYHRIVQAMVALFFVALMVGVLFWARYTLMPSGKIDAGTDFTLGQ